MRRKHRGYLISLHTIARAAAMSRVRVAFYAQEKLLDQTELDLPRAPFTTSLAEDIR